MDFREAITEAVDRLNTVTDEDDRPRVPATHDPATVTVPGALVQLAGIVPGATLGGVDVDLRVVLIAPDVGWNEAVVVLEQLLAAALEVIDPNNGRIEPVVMALPDSPPLPGLALPTTLTVC